MHERIGVIDIGSNTIHSDVFEIRRDGTLWKRYSAGTVNRLGIHLGKTKVIPPRALADAVRIICRLYTQARKAGATRVGIFATSILREASNAATLCRAVKKRCGCPVDILSARREASLLSRIAQQYPFLQKKPVLFIDLGGGSAEYSVRSCGRIEYEKSFAYGLSKTIGMMPYRNRYGSDAARWYTAFFTAKIKPCIKTLSRLPLARVVGTSSVVKTIGMVCYPRVRSLHGLSGKNISVAHLRRLCRTLQEGRPVPRLDPVRREIVYSGVLYFLTLLARLKKRHLYSYPLSIREGYVMKYITRQSA